MAQWISWLSHNHLVSSLIGTKLKYNDRWTICLQVCLVFVNSLHQSIIYIHFTIYFHDYNTLSWSILSISRNSFFTNYPIDIKMTTNKVQTWCWEFFINWRTAVDTSCNQLIHPENKQQLTSTSHQEASYLGQNLQKHPFYLSNLFWEK